MAHGLPLSQLCHTSINILLQSNPILGQSIWIKFNSEADVEFFEVGVIGPTIRFNKVFRYF